MSNAAEVVTVTLGGRAFRCGRRTAAHLEWTLARLAVEAPAARLVVIQPPYNEGVDASAGTHDKDGVLDVQIVGLSWWEAQAFLRRHGWAAWYRFPPAFSEHIHMISLGCPGPLGIYVPGQIDDYYRHALGLSGQHTSGSDRSWFPADIDSTVFDYAAWEADMPLNEADKEFVRETIRSEARAAVDALLDAQQANGKTLRENIRIGANARDVAREILDGVQTLLAQGKDKG